VFYDELTITEIKSPEDYSQAWETMVEEFPDHKDTNLLEQYEWILITKKSNEVLGVITANKYLPNKALLCDIVVKKEHRSRGIGMKLLKGMSQLLRQEGFTHLLGFTPKKSKDALNTYKRFHTHQEEMIVTTGTLDLSIAHMEQMEMVLRARDFKRKFLSKKGK
jgi:GNAT superfamily N-acetyltransferase